MEVNPVALPDGLRDEFGRVITPVNATQEPVPVIDEFSAQERILKKAERNHRKNRRLPIEFRVLAILHGLKNGL